MTERIGRRAFLRIAALALALPACSPENTSDSLTTPIDKPAQSNTPKLEDASTPTTTLTPKPSPTQKETPSPTSAKEILKYNSQARENIKAVMQDYGRTDKERLGIDYWKKMEERIDKYGPAKRIINFELHGDNYSFYDGGYSMNPEAFKRQMTYLCQEDYHFVTAPELLGFLEGWIELPARSVILTTDSSNRSVNSLARIMEDFSSLQGSYETYPHVLSFIWTLDMTPQEKAWDTFRQALESGHFSIGTHTESHKDFRQMSPEMGIADLRQSKQKIKNKLGINVYGISWPFEGCPSYREELEAEGFKFAFGGRSRGLAECYTYKNDSLRLCLPRVFPPNPNGVSGRPNGKTLEEMLSDMISEAN